MYKQQKMALSYGVTICTWKYIKFIRVSAATPTEDIKQIKDLVQSLFLNPDTIINGKVGLVKKSIR